MAFSFRCAVRLIGRPQPAVIAVAGLRIQGCEDIAGRTNIVAGVEVAENRVVFRAFEGTGIRCCDRTAGPKILGDSTGLSAFWVVFSILFGGGMFGFVGMILGVPTFAVIYYIVKMLVNHQLENHTLPTDTGAYDQFGYVNNEGEYARVDEATEKKEEKGE